MPASCLAMSIIEKYVSGAYPGSYWPAVLQLRQSKSHGCPAQRRRDLASIRTQSTWSERTTSSSLSPNWSCYSRKERRLLPRDVCAEWGRTARASCTRLRVSKPPHSNATPERVLQLERRLRPIGYAVSTGERRPIPSWVFSTPRSHCVKPFLLSRRFDI